ncbi:MAG: HAD-IA family hydrolase [Burkholderiaceae bacterium]
MRRFDLVVFDWDGTIIDSVGAVSGAMIAAAVDLGLKQPSEADARWTIGLGLMDAIRHAVPDLTKERIPEFLDRYRVHYLRLDPELQVFTGITELLRGLDAAGVPLAVATGKSRVGLNRALAQTGLAPRFVATRCADEGEPKPHPWMLHDLGEALQVPAERMLMIGDTTHDVGMAQAAGAHSLAVLYGAHDPQALKASRPGALVESVPDLARWLAGACAVDPGLLGA